MAENEAFDNQFSGGSMQLTWMLDTEMPDEGDDEMDDMPPLVEQPGPSSTFHTFSTSELSQPVSMPDTTIVGPYSEFTINLDRDLANAPRGRTSIPTSQPYQAHLPDPSGHIPRPPNAFILFRSAFIRSQKITGKVEGNHSTLSKIIGMYWRKLSSSERAVWEEKARIAQDEHRTKYPDWRFRTSSNTIGSRRGKRGRRGGFIANDGRGRGAKRKGREVMGAGDPGGAETDPDGSMGAPDRASRKRRLRYHDDEDYQEDDEEELSPGEDGNFEDTQSRTRVGSSSRSKGKGKEKARAPPRISISESSSPSSSSSMLIPNSTSASTSGLASISTTLPSTSGSSVSVWRTHASHQSTSSSTSVIPPQSSTNLSPYASSLSPSPSTSATPPTTSPVSASSFFPPRVGVNPDETGDEPTTPEHHDNSVVSEPEQSPADGISVETSNRSRRPRSSTVPTRSSTLAAEAPVKNTRSRYSLRRKKAQDRTSGRGTRNSNPAISASHDDYSTVGHPSAAELLNPASQNTIRKRVTPAPPSPGSIPTSARTFSVSPAKSRDKFRGDDVSTDVNGKRLGVGDTRSSSIGTEEEREREKERDDRRIRHIAALLQEGKEGAELEQAMERWVEEEERKEIQQRSEHTQILDAESRPAQTQVQSGVENVGAVDKGKGRERSISPGDDERTRVRQNHARITERGLGSPGNHPTNVHPSFDFSNSNSDSETDTETLRGRAGGDWGFSRFSPIEGSLHSQRQQEQDSEELSEGNGLPIPQPLHMDSLPTENVLPLTHMFKRSLSEPASGKRVPYTTPGSEEEGFTEQEQAGEQGNPSNVVLSVGPGTIDFYTDRGSGGGGGSGGSGGGNGQESSSSTTGSVWPSLSPLSVPAHAASVPEAHPSPRAVPPNTQRAYTHPDLHLQAHINRPFQPSITHPQSYAPFASSPLSLSPGSISPPLTSSSFPSVSSLSPISPPTIQYGFPSTTTVPYTGGQIHELNQSQYHYPVVHGHQHHHQPGHSRQQRLHWPSASLGQSNVKGGSSPGSLPGSIDSSMSEMGFPGPGQGAGQSTRRIRTSVSHSHLRGSYREDYQTPHQRPPLTPSPRSPSTPELQQQQQNARSKQETAFSQNRNQGGFPSYAHTSSFSFPRRGSIAFPIGSSSTSRPSDSDIGTMGSSVTGGGRHRRSMTSQDAEQRRNEEIDAVAPDDTLPESNKRYIGSSSSELENALGTRDMPSSATSHSGTGVDIGASVNVDSEIDMAKYKYPPQVQLQDLMSTENMGYIVTDGTSTSSQLMPPDDDSHDMQWPSASHGRTGRVHVIVDPYIKDYESLRRDQEQRGREAFVHSSTYSSLQGWAGDSGTSSSSSIVPGSAHGTATATTSIGQPVSFPQDHSDSEMTETTGLPYHQGDLVWTGYTAYSGKPDGFQPVSIVGSGIDFPANEDRAGQVGSIVVGNPRSEQETNQEWRSTGR